MRPVKALEVTLNRIYGDIKGLSIFERIMELVDDTELMMDRDTSNPANLILDHFTWNETDEGGRYWDEVYNRVYVGFKEMQNENELKAKT